jgi:hypothetical protein
MKRPKYLDPPAYLSKSPPVPEPKPAPKADATDGKADPTRYGDWERKGIAWDF